MNVNYLLIYLSEPLAQAWVQSLPDLPADVFLGERYTEFMEATQCLGPHGFTAQRAQRSCKALLQRKGTLPKSPELNP